MTKNQNAVRYLRSSKDRHDVSIEAQRHELDKLAAELGLRLAGEYVDTVESGKDEERPGFQRLLADLRSRERAWSTILLLDTSRLARRLAAAVKFEEECRGRGVQVLYKSLPQSEEAERALIKAVLHGVDEWHSLVSKRKGLAGMRQNVEQGYRAGGRAPLGYRLEHVALPAMRDGKPVTKSRLVPGPDAARVQRYLKARAAGARRAGLVERLGLVQNESSLVGVEWNALTYAGHTVWMVHSDQPGVKRRPRAVWVIQRDTHEALITEAAAEAIVARLEAASVKRPRRTAGEYLFTGLLRTSEGAPWYGERARYYRTGNAYVQARDVEQTLLAKVAADLRSSAFSAALVRRARASYGKAFDAELERLRGAEAALQGRISRYLEIAEKNDLAEPALRKVAELERERKQVMREMDQARRDAAAAAAARAVREDQVGRMLDAMAADMARLDRDKLKDFLFTICERITLNPQGLTARIHYKIPLARRDSVASPREHQPIPHAKTTSCVRIRRAA
jgi:DNA invertase Pin-like site-specific DNA recombinase